MYLTLFKCYNRRVLSALFCDFRITKSGTAFLCFRAVIAQLHCVLCCEVIAHLFHCAPYIHGCAVIAHFTYNRSFAGPTTLATRGPTTEQVNIRRRRRSAAPWTDADTASRCFHVSLRKCASSCLYALNYIFKKKHILLL